MSRITGRWAFATVGLAAGFSGMAVLATILTGGPLLVFQVSFVGFAAAAVAAVAYRSSRPVVLEVLRVTRAGFIAGGAATVVYDVTRATLSVFDPSPYNPFEAIRQFGLAVLPEGASRVSVMLAGGGIHLLNGSTFGVIYAIAGGRHASTTRGALGSGILWGLTLELIMSIVYPGWLNITALFREFLLISALGHLAYGATLGLGAHRLLWGNRSHEEAET